MKSWAEKVYQSGFEDGRKRAEGLTVEDVHTILVNMKGIGEKKMASIMEVVTARMGEKLS